MALTQGELFKLDLYDLLGLDTKCTLQEIKRAFRKNALKCHPDKNPDDPNAAQLFHQLSCALEILSDESARNAYDKVLNARKANTIRNLQLDSKRRKLKEDLERRERMSQNQTGETSVSDEAKLKAEIERLRKEGSRLLQEEIQKVKDQLNSPELANPKVNENGNRDRSNIQCFTVRWKAEKGDAKNGGYSYDLLYDILSRCGKITALVVSSKKKGRAVVEFKTCNIFVLQGGIGLPHNPLVVDFLKGSKSAQTTTSSASDSNDLPQSMKRKSGIFPSFSNVNQSQHFGSSKQTLGKDSSCEKEEMHENAVLQRLRNMEKMKRDAEQNSPSK